MATYTIAAGGDDGRATLGGDDYSSGSDALWGDFSSGVYDYYAWFRFPGVALNNSAAIGSASLHLRALSLTGSIVGAVIFGIAADNPSAPTTNADAASRTLTSASVAWTPGAWVADTSYDTPDLTPIVQEIVNRAGWASGNAMMFYIMTADAGYGGANNNPHIYTYDWDIPSAPQFNVLTSPQVATTPCTVTIVDAQATGVTAVASTGVTITKPTGVANRDVLYAFISKTTYANTNNFTCAGWSDLSPATDGTTTGNDRHLNILRKVITDAANEPASYTFLVSGNATSSQMCGIVVALRGVDNTTPEDITVPAYGLTSNDATPASLNATSVTAGVLAIAVHQLSLATTGTKTPGAPNTYALVTNGNVSATSGSLDNQTFTATKTLGAAGSSTGTNSWTHTADDATSESLTAVVLVRPCAAVSIVKRRLRPGSRLALVS